MRRILCLIVMLLCLGSVATATADGWTAWGQGQSFTALAATPDGSTMYAGGGAWLGRSADGGATWQALTVPDGVTDVRGLAVDPASSQTIYLVAGATGQAGLYRSADGGRSWQTVRDAGQGNVSAITVAAQPPHRIVIGSGGLFPSSGMAVLLSDDGGLRWREVWRGEAMMGAGSVTSLAAPDRAVLAGVLTYHGGGIVLPGGLEGGWTIGQRHGPTTGFAAPAQLALGPRPGALYARWQANGPFFLASLRKTADAGQTWQDITPPLAGKSGEQASQVGSPSPYLTALDVDSRQAGRLFAAGKWCIKQGQFGCADDGWGVVVQESRDDGATWQAVGQSLPVQAVKALAYSPAHASLVAATDQGLWRYALSASATSSVAPWFQRYYDAYDGLRLLGQPLAAPMLTDGWPAQLFEKGRVEDHSAVERDPAWKFMYGLLVDELVGARSPLPVGGDRSTLTYADLADAASEAYRLAPPAGLTRGTYPLANGSVFVPLDPKLDAGPGHTVPPVFWAYINRADLFPGGWLHDVGLPITEPLTATVDKGDTVGRRITVQAFQRTVLTYDPLNPVGWQVERANVGRDYAALERR